MNLFRGDSDTRAKLIDPAIHARGWTDGLIRREEAAGAIEIIDGKLRDELLNAELFADLREAKALAAAWQRDYNRRRPHSSPGDQTRGRPTQRGAARPNWGRRPQTPGFFTLLPRRIERRWRSQKWSRLS